MTPSFNVPPVPQRRFSSAARAFELFVRPGQPGDERDGFPAAAFLFERDAHDAIAFGAGGCFLQRQAATGLPAVRANPAGFGGVDGARIVIEAWRYCTIEGQWWAASSGSMRLDAMRLVIVQ